MISIILIFIGDTPAGFLILYALHLLILARFPVYWPLGRCKACRIYPGICNFSLLNVWNSNQVFFVIRHKHNICFESIKENDLPEQRHQHILKDELIQLTGTQSKKKYPKRLRRVAICDEENQQTIELITNQMSWTANEISELYKLRWQIEIFFREIKQTFKFIAFKVY